MRDKGFQYEKGIEESLNKLIEQLSSNEVIISYKTIAEKVDKHDGLKHLVEDIKRYQKEAVQFDYYDKPEAKREALRLANEKQKEFDEHLLVIDYREKLIEANDLLQHVTQLLENSINDELDKKLGKK